MHFLNKVITINWIANDSVSTRIFILKIYKWRLKLYVIGYHYLMYEILVQY